MKIQTEEGGDGDGRVETYYTITSIPLWISWGVFMLIFTCSHKSGRWGGHLHDTSKSNFYTVCKFLKMFPARKSDATCLHYYIVTLV